MFFTEYRDDLAIRNAYDGKDIIKKITLSEVKNFLLSLGVEEIDMQDNYLVCPTICHNTLDEAESMKLYYYDKTKNFHCYTQCSENFNIVELYKRYMSLNHHPVDYYEAIEYIRNFIQNVPEQEFFIEKKEKKATNIIKQEYIELPEYNKGVLDIFVPFHHPLWLKDGIGEKAMDKFGIGFSLGQNKITIPHYDFNGRLVGIRGRAIDEKDIEIGKYMPMYIGETIYTHQLGFNLYGINEHKEAIRRTKRAVIFESEKSVLLSETYYEGFSTAVATCGSQLNKFQINLLIKKLGVNEIILAFDKEYTNPYDEKGKNYRKKLIDKCSKYKGLADFYYIFDEHGLLEEKDAPCDKGQEVLEALMKRRIKIK